MNHIQHKLKIFRQEIRSKALAHRFQQIRSQQLRQITTMNLEQVQALLSRFPEGLQEACIEALPQECIIRLSQYPHDWLANSECCLNLTQWSCLAELLIKLLASMEEQDQAGLLESARRHLCLHFAHRLTSHKVISKEILALVLDLLVEARAVLPQLHEDYACLAEIVFSETLALPWSQNTRQIIKALALCNQFVLRGPARVAGKVLGEQKMNLLRMVVFLEESCFSPEDSSNALIESILILLVNYTREGGERAFYRIFTQSRFKQFVSSCLGGTSFKHLELLLKLIYNIVLDDPAFSLWFKAIPLGLLEEEGSMEAQGLLWEIRGAAGSGEVMSV